MTILLCLCTTYLMAEWSSPPLIIYPSAPPYNAVGAAIAIAENGNAVAVWFDVTGSGSFQAATLVSGAVNEQGQPAWILTDPIASSDVQDGFTIYSQTVGMDAEANAMAVWTDGVNVYVAKLAAGASAWQTPVIINTQIGSDSIVDVYIGVSSGGNAIVTWTSSTHSYDCSVLANVFDFEANAWRGQTNILPSAIEFDAGANQVFIDPNGNAVITTTKTSNAVQVVSYNFDLDTWTSIENPDGDLITFMSGAIDSQGNATIIWMSDDGFIHVATLVFNASSFTNQSVLSTSAALDLAAPMVVVDAFGNAVACWPDVSGNFASARFSFASQSWTILDLLDIEGVGPALISLAGDSSGNAIASWTSGFQEEISSIQTAFLSVGLSSWNLLSEPSSSSDMNGLSRIVLTSEGDAVIIWGFGTDDFFGSVASAIFLDVSPPSLPRHFKGKVVLNRFLTGSVPNHYLTWQPSATSNVIEYRLYRNSILINTQSSGLSSYSYMDKNRSKTVPDVYMLVAIREGGSQSFPLFVTLP